MQGLVFGLRFRLTCEQVTPFAQSNCLAKLILQHFYTGRSMMDLHRGTEGPDPGDRIKDNENRGKDLVEEYA